MRQIVVLKQISATVRNAVAFWTGPTPLFAHGVRPRFPGLRDAAGVVVVSAGIDLSHGIKGQRVRLPPRLHHKYPKLLRNTF